MSDDKNSSFSPVPPNQEQLDSLSKTSTDEMVGSAYIDALSNQVPTDRTAADSQKLLEDKFRLGLPDAANRLVKLPNIDLRNANSEHVRLLQEARDLFTAGYLYSCVAMCGIVQERVIKDLLRDSVLIGSGFVGRRPTDDAFDQLERVDVSSLVRFLSKVSLISDDAKKAAERLIVLRNQYAHARGTNPADDALEAIQKLHQLINGMKTSKPSDFQALTKVWAEKLR